MSKLLVLVLACLISSSCASIPNVVQSVADPHRQIILVESRNTSARLSFWEKKGQWVKTLQCLSVIGRNGLAKPGEKQEGDGKTPQGQFDLKRAFGQDPVIRTGLTYAQVSASDKWVDDIHSSDYNRWVKTTNATSFEQLSRPDGLYRMAVVIEYNTSPVIVGDGSAIFLHIWRNYHHPTSGCVAVSKRNIRLILAKLDQTKKPIIVLKELRGS